MRPTRLRKATLFAGRLWPAISAWPTTSAEIARAAAGLGGTEATPRLVAKTGSPRILDDGNSKTPGQSDAVPPAGFEPAHPAPEAGVSKRP